MQEKIVPLIKAIKTKEPAVMIASLNVLRVVGDAADADFVAMDILPILWNMSLGPLLNLKQFQSFMDLIKSLSRRVEEEQTKKLQELSVVADGGRSASPNEDFMAFGGVTGTTFDSTNGATEDDFERLVKGKSSHAAENHMDVGWDAPAAAAAPPASTKSPQFSWSTPSPSTAVPSPVPKLQSSFRTVTPDLNRFEALTPSSTQFSKPLQPTSSMTQNSPSMASPQASSGAFNWSTAAASAPNPWASSNQSTSQSTSSFGNMASSMSNMTLGQQRPAMNQSSSFSLPPPPSSGRSTPSGFSLPPPPGAAPRITSTSSFGQPSSGFGGLSQPSSTSMNNVMNPGIGGMNSMNSMNNMMGGMANQTSFQMPKPPPPQPQPQPQQQQSSKSGLDKYESLI